MAVQRSHPHSLEMWATFFLLVTVTSLSFAQAEQSFDGASGGINHLRPEKGRTRIVNCDAGDEERMINGRTEQQDNDESGEEGVEASRGSARCFRRWRQFGGWGVNPWGWGGSQLGFNGFGWGFGR